jgi:adenylate kinase
MIIFMGVAGAGKSAQGKMLADSMAVPWVSTGEFLRMLITGQRRKDMLAGKLLGDQEIIAMVQKIFSMIDLRDEFVLDGFPRTANQSDWLLNQAKHGLLPISAVIHLTASEEAVRERLMSRGRQDDNREAITARFKEYEQTSKPILKHFKEAGVPVFVIKGEGEVETIHENIKQALKSL